VDAQQEKSVLKQFFRQGEISTLHKDCQTGLEQALTDFKACSCILLFFFRRLTRGVQVHSIDTLKDMSQMEQAAQTMHQEMLERIAALSDGRSSDDASSVIIPLSSFQSH
jgi:hypothetical protein